MSCDHDHIVGKQRKHRRHRNQEDGFRWSEWNGKAVYNSWCKQIRNQHHIREITKRREQEKEVEEKVRQTRVIELGNLPFKWSFPFANVSHFGNIATRQKYEIGYTEA